MKTISGRPLSRIGIGTYGIGGRGHRDLPLTEKQPDATYVDALVYTLGRGSNFTEISLGYGHGNSIALLSRAIRSSGTSREDLFITHSLYTRDLPDLATVKSDIAGFHETIRTEYADSTLVTQSLIQKFGESAIYGLLHDLLKREKSRYVSLSNAGPAWIRKFKTEFGDKFFAHEGHLSFEVRALQDEGIFDLCEELGVNNIIWRPLRRNLTLARHWPLLQDLSRKYQKTQSQIILNWMCELGYRPMVFSTNPSHIDENLSATDFSLSPAEYRQMTNFRPTTSGLPAIHWNEPTIDDEIVEQLKDIDRYLVS